MKKKLWSYTRVPSDEPVGPGSETVVDEDHGLEEGQHGGTHTHPAHGQHQIMLPCPKGNRLLDV